MAWVNVITGKYSTGRETYREISNVQFPAIDTEINSNVKGNFIVVDGTPVKGYPKRSFKVFINTTDDFTISEEPVSDIQNVDCVRVPTVVEKTPERIVDPAAFVDALNGDDDEVVKARIQERFGAMSYIVQTAADGDIRGAIISGPPGAGKSWGVRAALVASLENKTIQDRLLWEAQFKGDKPKSKEQSDAENTEQADLRFKFISGHVTPGALHGILFAGSDERTVTVFDDCDSVLQHEDSLNMLKKALDTTVKTRIIEYHSTSNRVSNPRFEFRGSVIFITNINFEAPKKAYSAIAAHLDAILSRVYYIDLAMHSLREKYLRIEQVCRDHNLLHQMGLEPITIEEVMTFFKNNILNFREVSIRTVEKIATLAKINSNWQRTSEITLFKTAAILDYEAAELRDAKIIADAKESGAIALTAGERLLISMQGESENA